MVAVVLLLAACSRETPKPQPLGDAARGKAAIEKYGCASCHAIPGVEGPRGMVGPPLAHIASQPTLGNNKVPNTPPQLAKWLQNPQGADPASAMPNIGVTEPDARDISAYLFTLK